MYTYRSYVVPQMKCSLISMSKDGLAIRTKHSSIKTKSGPTNFTNTNLRRRAEKISSRTVTYILYYTIKYSVRSVRDVN